MALEIGDGANPVGCVRVDRPPLVISLGICKWVWESQVDPCVMHLPLHQAGTSALTSMPKNLSFDLC